MIENINIDKTVYFMAAAIGIAVYETVAYLISVIKGQTSPHILTYLNWSILAGLTAYAQFELQGGFSAWVFCFIATSMFLITVLAFFKGEKTIEKSDWATFIFALSIIPVWYLTKQPILAIVLIMLIDLCTYYPTVRKSWNKPYSEPARLYALTVISSICIALSIANPNTENMTYPIFAILLDAAFVLILLFRRRGTCRIK